MVLLELSIFPTDKGESLSPYVARCLKIIDESGLDYRLHAMGTVTGGEIDQLLALVRQCFDALAVDCNRVCCSAKFDYRKGRVGRLESKIASIEEKLDRKLKK